MDDPNTSHAYDAIQPPSWSTLRPPSAKSAYEWNGPGRNLTSVGTVASDVLVIFVELLIQLATATGWACKVR